MELYDDLKYGFNFSRKMTWSKLELGRDLGE